MSERGVAVQAARSGSDLVPRIREHWLRRLCRPAAGSLCIELPSGKRMTVRGKSAGREAQLSIHRWRALLRIAIRGDIGFAESICNAECASSDLHNLLHWGAENCRSEGFAEGMLASRIVDRFRHFLRGNTRIQSRRNIAAHYDLGNDFYALWLDEAMQYSSALFTSENQSLEDAQGRKLARICDLLELKGGERILEIGCGWGGFAERAATAFDVHVTGITLSRAQKEHALARLREAGLESVARIELRDYRDVEGAFDRIASIEMLEAVGESYWPAYFAAVKERLVPGGVAVIQSITIDEARFEAYRRRPDFIQLSIFPGGMLPTRTAIADHAKAAGLDIVHSELFGQSYARTLAIWRQRFRAAWPRIAALGYDERFSRMWDYYLAYCQVGFEAGWIDVGLFKLRRP